MAPSTSGLDPGLVLDRLGRPVREALRIAADLGFHRLEIPAAEGETSPQELSSSGRRELVHQVRSRGMQLSALGADLGGSRLAHRRSADRCLSQTRKIAEMARQMGVPLVTVPLGRWNTPGLPADWWELTLRELADLADRTGTMLALRPTGCEPAAFSLLLNKINCDWLGVCMDPADWLIDGYELAAAFEAQAGRMMIAHARDATTGMSDRPGREVSLGQGDVDWRQFLVDLDQAGCPEPPLIQVVDPSDPISEAVRARDLLMNLAKGRPGSRQ